jgi:HD-like signal output (HDOD) protein
VTPLTRRQLITDLLMQGFDEVITKPFDAKQHIKTRELLVMMAAHHKRFGAIVLKKLGYPETFTALVRHHHRSEADPAASPALKVLQLADQLAKAADFPLAPEVDLKLSASLAAQGYTAEMQTEMTEQIKAQLDQLRYLLG